MGISLLTLTPAQPPRAAEPAAETEPKNPAPVDPQLVERWDARYRTEQRPTWDTGRPSSELKRLVEQTTLRTGRVLELGCGTGVNAVYLARQGFEVTAIDLAPTALQIAEERARKLPDGGISRDGLRSGAPPGRSEG